MDDQLYRKFLEWERATRDTIDFKKIYADMAGDILAGLVLSEIVYWHLPNKHGNSKMRIQRAGFEWIACPRYEWWDRTRLSPRQIDRIIKQLVKLNLVYKKRYHFAGSPTMHVRINWEAFFLLWNSLVENPLENPYAPDDKSKTEVNEYAKSSAISPNGNLPNGEIQFTKNVNSYITETTDNKDSAPANIIELPTAAKPKAERPPDLMYNAVKEVWGYVESLNKETCKMLQGKATRKGFKEFNITEPVSPDELLAWAKWVRDVEYGGNPKLNMIADRAKVQSSIAKFRTQKITKPSVLDGLKLITADNDGEVA